MDTQRTVLWFVFGLSLILLWDRWQVYQGHNSMLRPSGTAPAGPAAAAASGGGQAPTGTAAPGSERIHIQTDVMQAEFDPVGATLVRVELSAEKPAPDWTEAGLARLLGLTSWLHSMGFGHVGGGAAGSGARVVLLDTSAGRTYQAQTGLIGGSPEDPFPNHRSTRFEVTAPARALGPGQDTLTVRFEAQSGGVRLVKTF